MSRENKEPQAPVQQQAPAQQDVSQKPVYPVSEFEDQIKAEASQAAVAQKKGHGWVIGIVAIVCIAAVCIVGMFSCSGAVSSSMNSSLFGMGSSSINTDVDMLSDDAIGVIEMSGTIQYDGSSCSPEGLKEQLDLAEENDNIKAVVIRVDSGGGTATAGEEMAEYVKQFSKPVVISSASINASAAYEISSQADYIFVAKTTEIGSIGTIMQSYDYSELLEKLGIKVDSIASAESKDSSYGARPLSKEERQHYQRLVNQINETFIQNVADGRKMDVKDVRKLATGLVFSGIDAVDNGLADEFGTKEDAIAKAAELAGVQTTDTVSLQPDDYSFDSLMSLLMSSGYDRDDVANALKLLMEESGKVE